MRRRTRAERPSRIPPLCCLLFRPSAEAYSVLSPRACASAMPKGAAACCALVLSCRTQAAPLPRRARLPHAAASTPREGAARRARRPRRPRAAQAGAGQARGCADRGQGGLRLALWRLCGHWRGHDRVGAPAGAGRGPCAAFFPWARSPATRGRAGLAAACRGGLAPGATPLAPPCQRRSEHLSAPFGHRCIGGNRGGGDGATELGRQGGRRRAEGAGVR